MDPQIEDHHTTSTKNRLLVCIDDIDLIIRQLFDTLSQQSSPMEYVNSKSDSYKMDASKLTGLLIEKNKHLSELAATAREQQKLHDNILLVKKDIITQNHLISCLQKRLKNAESTLTTSLYRAKEALKKFDAATKEAVFCEDVVRYAHKISAACSTTAPLNWTPGDPRRPYPQDIQMRSGLLGQINNMPRMHTELEGKLLRPLGTEGIQISDFSKVDSQWHTSQSADLPSLNLLKNHEEDAPSSESSSSDSSDSSFGND